jgi:hypothetical protein
MIEESLTRHVPRTQQVRFNTDGLIRVATLDRFRAHQIGINAGFETVDEVRAMERREPLAVTEASEEVATQVQLGVIGGAG